MTNPHSEKFAFTKDYFPGTCKRYISTIQQRRTNLAYVTASSGHNFCVRIGNWSINRGFGIALTRLCACADWSGSWQLAYAWKGLFVCRLINDQWSQKLFHIKINCIPGQYVYFKHRKYLFRVFYRREWKYSLILPHNVTKNSICLWQCPVHSDVNK